MKSYHSKIQNLRDPNSTPKLLQKTPKKRTLGSARRKVEVFLGRGFFFMFITFVLFLPKKRRQQKTDLTREKTEIIVPWYQFPTPKKNAFVFNRHTRRRLDLRLLEHNKKKRGKNSVSSDSPAAFFLCLIKSINFKMSESGWNLIILCQPGIPWKHLGHLAYKFSV